MRARLELQRPAEQLWLVIQNNTDATAQLDAIEIIVRWQGFQRSAASQPFSRRFDPHEEFPLEVTNLVRNAIQEAFPRLPKGEEVEVIIQLLAGSEGAIPSPAFRLKLEDGKLSV